MVATNRQEQPGLCPFLSSWTWDNRDSIQQYGYLTCVGGFNFNLCSSMFKITLFLIREIVYDWITAVRTKTYPQIQNENDQKCEFTSKYPLKSDFSLDSREKCTLHWCSEHFWRKPAMRLIHFYGASKLCKIPCTKATTQ